MAFSVKSQINFGFFIKLFVVMFLLEKIYNFEKSIYLYLWGRFYLKIL